MKTLERGPRKRKKKKLYRFKQLLNFYGSPFYLWRTRIDAEERRVLGLAGFQIDIIAYRNGHKV